MKRGAVMHDGSTCGDCLVASVSLDGNLAISGRVSSRRGVGAGDGIRTRDIQLGRLALYQLSYSRAAGLSHPHFGGSG